MKKFMISGAHGKAMRKLAKSCDEAVVAHWNQESSELPTWLEAYARLRKEGRRSKVNHPSGGQVPYEFPEPQVGSGELRFTHQFYPTGGQSPISVKRFLDRQGSGYGLSCGADIDSRKSHSCNTVLNGGFRLLNSIPIPSPSVECATVALHWKNSVLL